MRHCAAPTCPFAARYGRAAEYGDAIATCVDCGGLLSDGPAPEPPATDPQPALPPVPRALWLRGAVTALVAGLALMLFYLPLPVSDEVSELATGGQAGLLAVGIAPLLLGFGLVELLAALVPPLRLARYAGPRGRSRLVTGSIATGVALTLVTTTLTMPPLSYMLQVDPRVASLLLVAAPLALFLAARGVDRFGVGGGLPVVAATLVVPQVAHHVARLFAEGSEPTSGVGEAAMLLAVALLVAPVWWTAQRPERRPRWLRRALGDGPATLPLSGGTPLTDLLLPLTIAAPIGLFFGYWLDVPAFLYVGFASTAPHLAAVGGATLLLGWLYQRPRNIAPVLRGLGLDDGRDAEAQLRRGAWRALLGTVAIVVIATALWSFGAYRSSGSPPPLGHLAILAVVGLDLRAEWRARRVLGPLTRAWCLHRTYAVGPVLSALEREGIDAFARSRHLRALLPFLASWAPIDVLVRPGDEARARAFLAARLGGAAKLSRDAILDALS